MGTLERTALDLLRSAPVHSPALLQYQERITTDEHFTDLPPDPLQYDDFLSIDDDMTRGNGISPALARMEQRATYFLAGEIALYRRPAPRKRWPDERTKDDRLLCSIRDYHLALMHAHAVYLHERQD